ncbi:MAG TPA: dTMP kinase [Patescibacteria group bacterium]|nr:dTMP kinase [Patescibacteria group bacterium]
MRHGMFFAFEGIDGSGLTTQASLLKEWFEKQGFATFLTKEPTGGPIGSQIRLVLSKRLSMEPTALALAFAADRMDHLHTDILPKVEKGVVVISDRYYLSSYAYQAFDADLKWLMQINSKCLKPHMVFLLDVPALICKKRMERMRWHVELFEETEKLENVRKNFHSLAEELRDDQNIRIIDGNRPLMEVHRDVRASVTQAMKTTNEDRLLTTDISDKEMSRITDFLGRK